MKDLLDRAFGGIDALTSPVRELVSIGLLAIVVGIAAAAALAAAKPPPEVQIGLPGTLVGFGILLLLYAVAVNRRLSADATARPPGGACLMGCWMGRSTVVCGVVRVNGKGGHELPSSGQLMPLGEPVTADIPAADQRTARAYDVLAGAVITALKQTRDHRDSTTIAAICIGTPGVVDLVTGGLLESVTVPANAANLPAELATRLLASDRDCVERALGSSRLSQRDLEARISVDNDVRCVARYQIAEQQKWRSFACFYVGGGVGSALVFERQIHFGRHGAAGHIGHVELGCGPSLLTVDGGHALAPQKCACQAVGYHLDALGNGKGLRAIAKAIEDGFAPALAQVEQVAGDDAALEAALPRLLEARGPSGSKSLPAALHPLLDDPMVTDYLDAVLRAYVDVLARGIGILVDLGDFEQIVLCGRLAEAVSGHPAFRKTLKDRLPHYVHTAQSIPDISMTKVADTLWQGAALLAWDPAYHRERAARAR